MRRLRAYADTSVFGGCFDAEFSDWSKRFFAEAAAGRFVLLLSPTTLAELVRAPAGIRKVLTEVPQTAIEPVPLGPEAIALRDAYLLEGIVGPSHAADAEHIAIATVSGADLLVSWNFKHIVHFDRIRRYNSVNVREGYRPIPIHTPREVV